MKDNNTTTIIIDTEALCGENPTIEFRSEVSPPPTEAPYDWMGLGHVNDLSSEYDERAEVRGTFAAEPAVEQEPEPQPYDGWEGHWPGDGSGMDDLADWGEQEGWDN